MFRSSFLSFIFSFVHLLEMNEKKKKDERFFFCFRLNSPNSQKLGSFVHLLKILSLTLTPHLTLHPTLAQYNLRWCSLARRQSFYWMINERWKKKKRKINETKKDELFFFVFLEKDERRKRWTKPPSITTESPNRYSLLVFWRISKISITFFFCHFFGLPSKTIFFCSTNLLLFPPKNL